MAKKRKSSKSKRKTKKKGSSRGRKTSKTKRKVNRSKSRSKGVAKKKSKSKGGRSSGGFINKIPILKNKTVQRIGFGLGMASLAGIALRALPVPILSQNAPLVETGVAFAVDPLAGVARLVLGGGLGQLGNLLGGGNGGNGGGGNSGFA